MLKQHGSGIKKESFMDMSSHYEYWDNANELVARLRLLMASQMAGNNSHNNEIYSILEELREHKIIK
jgi:hypothetical protein